jgi:D-psicose/D-tagatose/L-ribulose 3-epimerase
MRFGLCTKLEQIDTAGSLGFDYLELPLAQAAALDEAAFAQLKQTVARSHAPAEACNIFFPADLRLTGEKADIAKALTWAQGALTRAAALGVRVVVFGSGGARNVPEGFPMPQAWAQLIEMLRGLDPIAGGLGITIAIEHLNRLESNIITSVADGLRLAKDVGRPHIRVLADSYHMLRENEDPAILSKVGKRLAHVHIARSEKRVYPTEADEQLRAFFASLRKAGYDGRVSIEGRSEDVAHDGPAALAVIRELGR